MRRLREGKLSRPEWHYYEAHVTIEPVFNERLEQLNVMARFHGFHVADLLMKKRVEDQPERSQYDSFTTARDSNLGALKLKTAAFVRRLRENGFQVWRYKIESTVFDSRYEDAFGILGDDYQENFGFLKRQDAGGRR